MMDELKACPFCGHQAERKGNRKYKKGYAATVGCMNQLCPAKIEQATICGTVEDAYKHAENVWNRRTQPESTISKVETVAQPENKPLSLEKLRQMDGEPVWWWNTTDKPRLTICNSAPYIPDVMFISFDWAKEDSTSITPYKKIIKWGYKPYARKPEQEEK